LRWGAALVGLATGLRLWWVLAVPTVPVSDFAMYRESANYLSEFGVLDPGFIYMPGFVYLLAWIKNLGGDLMAQKLIGVAFGGQTIQAARSRQPIRPDRLVLERERRADHRQVVGVRRRALPLPRSPTVFAPRGEPAAA